MLSEAQEVQLKSWMENEEPFLRRLREGLDTALDFAHHCRDKAQEQPEIITEKSGTVVHSDATAMFSASIYQQIVTNVEGSLKLLEYAQEHYRKPILGTLDEEEPPMNPLI